MSQAILFLIFIMSLILGLMFPIYLTSYNSIKNDLLENIKGYNIDLYNISSIDKYVNKLVSIQGTTCSSTSTNNEESLGLLSNLADNSTDNINIQYIYEINNRRSYKIENIPWGLCNDNIFVEIDSNIYYKLVNNINEDIIIHPMLYSKDNDYLKIINDSISHSGGFIDGGNYLHEVSQYNNIYTYSIKARLLKSSSNIGIIGLLSNDDDKYIIKQHTYIGEIYFGYIDFANVQYNHFAIHEIVTKKFDLIVLLTVFWLVLCTLLYAKSINILAKNYGDDNNLCHSCQRYKAVNYKCIHCDQLFCLRCITVCEKCLNVFCNQCKSRHNSSAYCKYRWYLKCEICHSDKITGVICTKCKKSLCKNCTDTCMHCRGTVCKDCWVQNGHNKICPLENCEKYQSIRCQNANCNKLLHITSSRCGNCQQLRCSNCTGSCNSCRSTVCNDCWIIRDNHKICPCKLCGLSQRKGCGCNSCEYNLRIEDERCNQCQKYRYYKCMKKCIHCHIKICNNCWIIRDNRQICPRNECFRSQTRGCGCAIHCTNFVSLTNNNCKKCNKLRCDDGTSDCIHCHNKICNNCWVNLGGVKTCPLKRCYQSQILCAVCNESVIGDNLVNCSRCHKIVCSPCSNSKICLKCLQANCPRCSNIMIKSINTNRCQSCRESVCIDCYKVCYNCDKKTCKTCYEYNSNLNNYKCRKFCWPNQRHINNTDELIEDNIKCNIESCNNRIVDMNLKCLKCLKLFCISCTKSCTSCNRLVCKDCWISEERKHQGVCMICPMCNANNTPIDCPICLEVILADDEVNCPNCEQHFHSLCMNAIKTESKIKTCSVCKGSWVIEGNKHRK